MFSKIIRENCTAEYNNYLHADEKHAIIDWLSGGDPTNQVAQPVV